MHRLAKSGLKWSWAALFAICCVLVAAYAFAFLRYRPYDPDDPFMVRFALAGLAVPAHFFGAGLALLLVPLQASARVRRRAPTLHRIGGGLSIGGILVSALGGLVLATQAHRGWMTGIPFAALALLWLAVTGIGLRHALRRDFVAHGRWMSRCIALTASAITLRIMLAVGHGVLALPFDAVYITAAWSCWIFNLAVCEAWLRRSTPRQPVMIGSALALR
jgi:hypothetical protein